MWARPKNFDNSRDKIIRISPDRLLKMRSKPNEYMYATPTKKTFKQLQTSTNKTLINPEYKDRRFIRARIGLKGLALKKYQKEKSTQEHGGRQYINRLATSIKSKTKKVPILVVYDSELKMNKVYQGRHRALAAKKNKKKIPIILRKPKVIRK